MAQKSQKTIKNGPKQSQKRQTWAPRPSRPHPLEPPAPSLRFLCCFRPFLDCVKPFLIDEIDIQYRNKKILVILDNNSEIDYYYNLLKSCLIY